MPTHTKMRNILKSEFRVLSFCCYAKWFLSHGIIIAMVRMAIELWSPVLSEVDFSCS